MVQKATFTTTGIVPLGCLSDTEKKLYGIRGVRNAAIDGTTNTLNVTYNSPEASLASIRAVLENCKYEFESSTEANHGST